ncbi:hypothetical protein C2E23DRAFT_888207 [Lenzites betulinus]|nr:hypothetical protein C2E23DRAFT_888207 [Lenzites betulinus]
MEGETEGYGVPMALDHTLSHTDGLRPNLAMARNRKLAYDAREHTVGPMPPAAFIATFLPLANDRRGKLMTFNNAFKAVPRTADTSAAIYKPLAAALNKKSPRRSRCPGFVFDTSIERSVRPLRLGYTKPHICCFTTANARTVRRADNNTRVELGYAELFVDVRPDPSFDYFIDPPIDANKEARSAHNFFREYLPEDEDSEYDQAERAFGLHIGFAVEILARQNRTCLFTVSVFGPLARLYRWDREGCIVTEAFDFHERPSILLEFFWRYSQAYYCDRGHDQTTVIARPQFEALFRDAIRAHVRSQLGVDGPELDKAVRAHYEPGHVTAVEVYPQPLGTGTGTMATTPEFRTLYLVSRPLVSPLYLVGRGTRGYWALQYDTGQIMFLKDTWCTWPADELEGAILARLNESDVRNIPQQVIHGLVPHDIDQYERDGTSPQKTRTGSMRKENWVCSIDGKRIRTTTRRHYRTVTDAAGYDLKTLRGTEELLHATYDVFTAMRDALAKAAYIHRDLSIGNIVLFKEPDRDIRRGYLIDWESSDQIDSDGNAEHVGRAGTWDFMSIRMLAPRDHERSHRFEDDMESLFYVVLYSGLKYLPHDLDMDTLTVIIDGMFRERKKLGALIFGDEGKFANTHSRIYTRLVRFGSPGFQEWVDTIMNYFWPPPELKERNKDMWDPVRIDAYWAEFLRTHTLERDNRVVHKIAHHGLSDLKSPPTTPSGSHTEDTPLSCKRHLEPSDNNNALVPTKLPRIDDGGHYSSPTVCTPRRRVAAHPFRRSERIRLQRPSGNSTK